MKRNNIMLCGIVIVLVIAVHVFFTKPLIASDSKEVTIPVQGYIGMTNQDAYRQSQENVSSYVQTGDTTSGGIHFILMLVSCILFIYILNWDREEEAKYNVF
jgi:hypothetical protein